MRGRCGAGARRLTLARTPGSPPGPAALVGLAWWCVAAVPRLNAAVRWAPPPAGGPPGGPDGAARRKKKVRTREPSGKQTIVRKGSGKAGKQAGRRKRPAR